MNRNLTLADGFIENEEAITRAMRRAVRAALLDHKRAGNPVAVWQNNRVTILQPDEIDLPPEDDEPIFETPT